jgi:hypothetical protein
MSDVAAAIHSWGIDSYRSEETLTTSIWRNSFLTMRTRFVRLVIRKIKARMLQAIII